ncbi:lipopolysaccharide biosynthesis protein [Billgrantia diversa]|uniref:Wzz/FepE/Etk N-terminal domain-containing protein n=1 Tax=Halomonas sp. MCCC 1A13316 TaxID=2733487 RepID=UPI0018A5DA4A|nr:Wzz/FepE/Etk N-terminal domain-containing protein [Halomonas sp. MCCC 1A13316]QOR39089.1 lipopolysaccharide biosynthesis protein [Halomonas sp. MCCC 1A13316]
MTTANSPQEPRTYHDDDEISLVDLAKILIKRWKAVVITFTLIVLAALAYALLQERTYQYVSIYHVAERAPVGEDDQGALETPNAVIAKIQNLYLGPVTRELLESSGRERLPFEITLSNPEDTLLVRITSEASETNQELVKQMHEQLLARVVESQNQLLARNRERLEQQLESAQETLTAAEEGEAGGELLGMLMNRVVELESQLMQLNEGQAAQEAVQSLDPTGTSRKLILALGIVLGGVLALMAAFFSHFASLVRASIKEEKKTQHGR